jgi:type I restriction enzyme S subunit
MSEWKEILLTDITTRIGDGLHGTPNYDNNGEYYFINGNNLVNGRILIKKETKTVSKSEFQKHAKLLNERTLLLGINGTIGNIAYYRNEKCMLGKSACYINLNDEVDVRFIYYTFLSRNFQDYIEGIATGTTIPNVPLKGIREYPFKIPPFSEQTAIASVLSSLDDKIDLLHRQNATLEKMAETLFRQWFVEEAKEEWEIVRIGDFVTTNKKTITKDYAFSEINYLDTSSLNKGLIIDLQVLSLKDSPSRAKRLVVHNDILISTVRPDQKHYGIIKDPEENLVVSTGFCVISCEKISPHFIYLLLTNSEMTEYLHSIAEGSTSTYPSLKPSDIEKIEFQLPSIEKLNEFERLVSSFWDKIKSNQTQIRTLTALRDTLLPKLMSGEVTVTL